MKTINYIVTMLLAGILFGCHDQLDQDPISTLTPNNFGRNATEVNILLMGCYGGMRAPMAIEWQMTELRSDNSLQGVVSSTSNVNLNLNALDMFSPSTSHSEIYQYWFQSYKNIAAANNVLSYINNVANESLRKQYQGEALLLRSYHYFNLVRLFGPIFLPLRPVSNQESKTMRPEPVDKVYAQIIEDLKQAADLLPERYADEDLGRATKWAAKGLLAKVYLTLGVGEYNNAKPLLEDIVANSGHTLLPSYASVFSINNEMNDEIIFAVRYKSGLGNQGSPFANMFAPLSISSPSVGVVGGSMLGLNTPTSSIINAFASNDTERRNANVGIYKVKATDKGTPYVSKYISKVVANQDADNDWPILRYSDVLLMLAEVKAHTDGPANAMTELNEVHRRATGADYAIISDLSVFMDTLLHERRLELAFENHRFFDLVRTGRAANVLTNHIYVEEWTAYYISFATALLPNDQRVIVKDDQLLLPIPQREIDTNPIVLTGF